MFEPIILVHGGAGDIPDSRISIKTIGIKKSANIGYEVLRNGGSVVDAVEAAVKCMEDDEAFNCGYGSVLNIDGEVEMDASIIEGANLSAGAVTVVKDIAHPISLARLVMEKTPHFLLSGTGANKFALDQGIPLLPRGALISPFAKASLAQLKTGSYASEYGESYGEVGTVGAVAIDSNGHLAAATSTGGLTGKMIGRTSDASILGSGTYADDFVGAVSSTGHGESIAKFCLAHSIIKEMEQGKSANEATQRTLKRMTARLNNTAGAISISKTGEIGIGFTTDRMTWAYRKGIELHYGINHNEDNIEKCK